MKKQSKKKEMLASMTKENQIAYHQKRLIPLNIVVCVLALVAALTLIFTPILKVNAGKVFASEDVRNELLGSATSGSSESGETDVISAVLNAIFEHVENNKSINIKLSAFDGLKVAVNGKTEMRKLLDGMVGNLTDEVVASVKKAFSSEKTKDVIFNSMVDYLADSTLEELKKSESVTPEMQEKIDTITTEGKDSLKEVAKKIDNVKSEEDMNVVAGELADEIASITGEELSATDREEIRKAMAGMYNDTMTTIEEEGKTEVEFSMETMISVNLTKEVDVSDLGSVIMGGSSDGSGSGSTSGKICTSYEEIANNIETEQLTQSIQAEVDKLLSDKTVGTIATYYSYVAYAFTGFAGIWFILFLFAFIHTFTKNKRFCMWYVKLLCWIPPLIWLIIKLVSNASILGKIAKLIGGDLPTEMISGIGKGIESFTWISGLCLILLYCVSFFWAFPIKHKIRKLKKQIKKDKKNNGGQPTQSSLDGQNYNAEQYYSADNGIDVQNNEESDYVE